MPPPRNRSGQSGNGGAGGAGVGQRHKPSVLKVVILGDGGVGKTCLISRFVNDKFDACSFHTIGVEFLNKDVEIDGARYTLQIWDTAGQERFKSLRTPFYRGADVCLLTYSVDDATSFDHLATWRHEFLHYAGVDETHHTEFPIVVVGNKADLEPESRTVSSELVREWCRAHGDVPHVETSAKDATNVEQAFALAVQSWLRMEEKLDRPFHGETVRLGAGGGSGGAGSLSPQTAGQTGGSCCVLL